LKLDHWPQTGAFTLQIPRATGVQISELMKQHGLDFSQSKSKTNEAWLFTHEPYAAMSFSDYATDRARTILAPSLDQIAASQASSGNSHIRVPSDKELWPFQKASVSYALNRNHSLIADQPGLGKTPIAIAFANEIRARRVLCIVPANIRLQWERRIREWTTMPWPYTVYPILGSRHGVHPTANWTIVSYDLARSPEIGASLARGTYDLLILDEAHYLKTNSTRRTQAVFGGGLHHTFKPLASRSGAIMALSGTPLPNRPREAYVLARNLCWDSIDFASEQDFRERFNPSMVMEGERYNPETKAMEHYVYVDERSGRHMELQNRLRVNFMARHLKHDVMSQLKLPIFDIIQVTETAAIKQAIEAERMLDIDPETLLGADMAINGQWAIIRHQLGVAMAPQIADYAEMLFDGGEEKLVLAGWHHDVLDIWEKKLEAYGVVRIDGRTTSRNKDNFVQKFIHDPKTRLCIGNMQSMGTGTDGLQEVCSHVLIGEPSPTPGENEQMVDRLNRIGQAGTVQADFFVAPNSIVERILASSLRKLQGIHSALDRKV
jgi:SWI/SNF-related matrix-associated actin-dependent regulator of chromatin subfamily A-like protein 1